MESNTGTVSAAAQSLAEALRDCRACLALFHGFTEDYALITLDSRACVATWSDGAERLTGYPANAALGRHLAEFYAPDDDGPGLVRRELAAAERTGQSESEGWRRRRDGSRFLARSLLIPLRDAAQQVRGYVQILHDMSGRRRLEKRFHRVVEAAPNAMVEVDTAGVITMVNVQAERMFGYTRAELLGQPIEMLVPERFRPHHPKQRSGFARAPVSRPMGAGRDLYARRKDGSEFAVEIGLNPVETQAGTTVLSAIVDISDRKNKESRIRAALAEKDVLLGEIHHRVKNNLQIVHSLLDLQSARFEDPAVLEMLRDTQNRIQSMALIHQILYQSRDFSGVDFRAFLDDLVPTLAAAYGLDAERIALNIDVADVLLPLNQAMPCGLIVNELITNSLKHAFTDGRRGHLDIIMSNDSAGRVHLIVRDDGVGFVERPAAANEDSHGLKLVNLLAEQLHGEVRVHQAQPTEFALSFPLCSARSGAAHTQEPSW